MTGCGPRTLGPVANRGAAGPRHARASTFSLAGASLAGAMITPARAGAALTAALLGSGTPSASSGSTVRPSSRGDPVLAALAAGAGKEGPGYDERRQDAARALTAGADVPHFPVRAHGGWWGEGGVIPRLRRVDVCRRAVCHRP